ncbi:unnamed protein product [Caretta caretta]
MECEGSIFHFFKGWNFLLNKSEGHVTTGCCRNCGPGSPPKYKLYKLDYGKCFDKMLQFKTSPTSENVTSACLARTFMDYETPSYGTWYQCCISQVHGANTVYTMVTAFDCDEINIVTNEH